MNTMRPEKPASGGTGAASSDLRSPESSAGRYAPSGFEPNWIPTVAGKSWFAYFRLYEPTESYFDRSWPLGDFEKLK